VVRYKLVLNILKIKSIVFGTNHSLNPKPQPNILMHNVEIEQFEVTKLLGVILDCNLSWSKHVDTTVAMMGRSLSIIKCCSTFLTRLSTRQVLQALVCCTWTTVQSCGQVPQRGIWKIAIVSEQGNMAGP
jgi:hypothetical protein